MPNYLKIETMNMTSFQLVVSDLDGTLVEYGSDQTSVLLQSTVAALRRRGVFFTLATGRSWKQTKEIVTELNIDIPVIVQAGALIVDPVTEQPIYVQSLEERLQRELSSIPVDEAVDQFCLTESGHYLAMKINTSGGQWLLQQSSEPCYIEDWKLRGDNHFIKHLLIGPEPPLRELAETVLSKIVPAPNLIFWPPDRNSVDWFLEVFDTKASKGQALQWLTKRLGITLNQAIAIGDGQNDLDILEIAGLGVAVTEASSFVKSKAKLIIPGPGQNGVAQFLNQFIESKMAQGM